LIFYRIAPYGLLCDYWDRRYAMSYYNKKPQALLKQISIIRNEPNTEKRLRMLQQLNDSLPDDIRLNLPSLITNAYVRKALDMIEERLLVSA
jgi:hypothetical protein